MTNQFWLSEPSILLNQKKILELWPTKEMTKNNKLNAITRLIILLTIIGYIFSRELKILITGLITIGIIILVEKIQKNQKKNIINTEAFTDGSYYKLVKDNFSTPTKDNPLMNVMLTDIYSNPNKKPAAPTFNPVVTEDINNATKKFVSENFNDPTIEEKLFKDLGDNFAFDQSMRTWYATPNTQIPNDQKKFAEFCYGGMSSCKEGHEIACSRK